MNPIPKTIQIALALTSTLLSWSASAQITNVVFSDDFSQPINSSKWVPDSPFFEGGKGDITNQVHDGVVEFTGTVSEQWWAGATLRAVPTFNASAETNVVVSVDRVSEMGAGTASRSALWIMDETRTKYILFADVRGEEGWRYNRKIGETSDNPTGGGTIMTAFDGETWDDSGLHIMKAVANGKTVRLYLDDVFGAEIKFPFNNLIFQIGSYARANQDTAGTVFDNFRVANVGAEAFSADTATIASGQTLSNITVRIPPGINQSQAVQVQVKTSDPAIAIPVGATGDTLTLTFAAGGPREQAIGIKSVGPSGSATLTLTNTIGMSTANSLTVLVVEGFGVNLTDEFTGASLDTTKWTNSTQPFEATGLGTFEVKQTGGQLVITGVVDQVAYWPGASVRTVKSYTATPNLPLSFEIDRVSINPVSMDGSTPSTAARTGVFITTADRSQYVFFAQNVGETGWEVNVNPGNPTGSGTAISQFASITNTNSHRIKMIADGSTVEVFLDDISGGKHTFAVQGGVFIEVGAYARDVNDSVNGVFDNAKIQHIVAPILISPNSLFAVMGVNTNMGSVTISSYLNATAAADVTVISSDANIAVPEGAVNGRLALTFPAGATNVQSFAIRALSPGIATFTLTNAQGIAAGNSMDITVVSPPVTVLSDDFSTGTLDTSKWAKDATPLIETGTATAESGITIVDGTLSIAITNETLGWPGAALYTVQSYPATATSPAAFEVDRTKMELRLVTGTGAKQRTGVWIKSGTNYIYFSELGSWDGTAGGWQYNRVIGQSGDNAITQDGAGGGVNINAFNDAKYTDQKNHHIRAVANGKTVKLYLDEVQGAEVAFPFSPVTFGIGAYVRDIGDTVGGFFDNAKVLNYPVTQGPGKLSTAKQTDGSVVISWTGSGTLQSTATITGGWADVSPAPTGTSFTVTPTAQTQQFYRLRQ